MPSVEEDAALAAELAAEMARLHAVAQFGSQQLVDLEQQLNTLDPATPPSSYPGHSMLYEVRVPPGVRPGSTFKAYIGSTLMDITCPQGVAPGDPVHVAGPGRASTLPPAPPRQARLPTPSEAAAAASVTDDGLTPRTAAVMRASEMEASAVEQLSQLFPALPPTEVRAVLERLGWDVNAAASELLELLS